MPVPRIEKWLALAEQHMTEHPGQFAVVRVDPETGESESATLEEIQDGATGVFALVNTETEEHVGAPLRIDSRGRRRSLSAPLGASEMNGAGSPFASIGKQSLHLSEGWEKLVIFQQRQIDQLNKQVERYRAELETAKDELREMSLEAAGGIEGEVIGVVKELIASYQGSQARGVVRDMAQKLLPKLSLEAATEVSRLLISEGYAGDGNAAKGCVQ